MRKWRYKRHKMPGRAAFKTMLRRQGFKVKRNFYGKGCCIAVRNGRLWRFRFWDGMVDISCPVLKFDRWANSTDIVIGKDIVMGVEHFKQEKS